MDNQAMQPYGYLWFTKHMERRFTHNKPDPVLMGMDDLKPLYEQPLAMHTLQELIGKVQQLESELRFERSHRQQAQKALMFWLPMVPNGPEEVSKRTANDAMLLMGYEGEEEPSAETLGWLRLDYTRRYAYLRERSLDSIEQGGIFAGKTPDNLVLNGEDLDAEIDEVMTSAHPSDTKEPQPQNPSVHVAIDLGVVSPDRPAGGAGSEVDRPAEGESK